MAYRAKRGFKRRSLTEGVRVVTAYGVEYATAVDVSGGGLRMILDRAVPLHSVLQIEFTLRGNEQEYLGEVSTLARVVRCVKLNGHHELGLQFVDLKPSFQESLQSKVDDQDAPF
jgi:c-di-GMP-binding flagellar brake protein YcgR